MHQSEKSSTDSKGHRAELLKYFRLNTESVLAKERVTTCAIIDKGMLALGTRAGMIHLVSVSGKILRSFKAHDFPINDIAVDYDGAMACCSDNCTVVVYHPLKSANNFTDEKPTVVRFTEPVKAVSMGHSIETLTRARTERRNHEINSPNSAHLRNGTHPKRTEYNLIAGDGTGQLTKHRITWYTQKKEVLFAGAGSAITTIAWLGDLVAWADSTQVRIMDANTLSAICYLNSPSGTGNVSFPCCLHWASNHDLFVGWADSFRHLEFMDNAELAKQSASPAGILKNRISGVMYARTVSDWQTDFLIAGLAPFDAEHVVLLGYSPPLLDNPLRDDGRSGSLDYVSDDSRSNHAVTGGGNEVEIHVCGLFNGKKVVSDSVSLGGSDPTTGPWAYKLCSSYDLLDRVGDALEWSLSVMNDETRFWTPKLFIISPQDLICSAVRDVNDYIGKALQDTDLETAVNLAALHPTALTRYKFDELFFLYISHLLDVGKCEVASSECSRLLQNMETSGSPLETQTMHLWEGCVYAFSKHSCLHLLAFLLPCEAPHCLSRAVYTFILEDLLVMRAADFAKLVEKWAPNRSGPAPGMWTSARSSASSYHPIYDPVSILSQLDALPSRNPWHCIARGRLHQILGHWELAVECYLESTVSDSTTDSGSPGLVSSLEFDYSSVFSMIVYNNLFSVVKDKLWAVSLLDRNEATEFFVNHRDVLPIPSVVQQLRHDRKSLHLYLHELFITAKEEYNVQEYAEYHAMQVSLYAEFAETFVRPNVAAENKREDRLKPDVGARNAPAGVLSDVLAVTAAGRGVASDVSDMLHFLKSSDFAPLDMALVECQKVSPPLYPEMVYIHTTMGNSRMALDILLREIGDVKAAVQFVESNDPKLWAPLTEYCLTSGELLGQMLDYVGVSPYVSPVSILAQVPHMLQVPRLRERLLLLNNLSTFRQFVTDRCNEVLADDTISLQRNLNQLKRKAVKVDPSGARCATCAKPVFIPTASVHSVDAHGKRDEHSAAGNLASKAAQQLLQSTKGGVWGRPLVPSTQPSGVLVFGNKLVFHSQCYKDLVKRHGKSNS